MTLLFTDLVGSTALLQAVGDDEAERLRRIHFGLLRDVAAAYSGQEVKNLGDGLMVAFSSAVDAVGCAIGISKRSTATTSARVTSACGFGWLLRALVGTRGSFNFRSCGSIELKGIAEPLPSCEIAWEPAPERRVPLPAPFRVQEPAPLVGRDAELDRLERCWQKVVDGQRGVAMLIGEPGIGKTRLAADLCRSAHADGALVLLGRCYEESLVPYQSFVEALGHYVSECSPEELRPQIGRHRAALAKLLPEVAEPGASPQKSAIADAGEREQFLLFDAVASLLCAAASERPLILLLDDLQWADASTLQMLRHIVRATEGAQLLLLGTYRETEVDQDHPLTDLLSELRRARALDMLALDGLGQGEVAALISAQSGREATATFAYSSPDASSSSMCLRA